MKLIEIGFMNMKHVFKKISKEELASYIELFSKNSSFKEAVVEETYSATKTNCDMLSDFLVRYAISTGDLSLQSIENISKDFLIKNHEMNKQRENKTLLEIQKEDEKRTRKNRLFDSVVSNKIIECYTTQFSIKAPISSHNMAKIINAIAIQNGLCKFNTHSFAGALYDDVSKNGLDISREYFNEEFKSLNKLTNSPYKIGKLCYCELSEASFDYLHMSPERLWMALAGGEKQCNGETKKEFAVRLLLQKLENSSFTNEEKNKIYTDTIKMIDFYCNTDDVCMAIMEEKYEKPLLFDYTNSIMNEIIFRLVNKIPKEYITQLKEIKDDKNIQNPLIKIEQILNEVNQISEESAKVVNDVKNDIMFESLTKRCLNNYENVNANGYEAEGGKISIDQMAIAKFPDISQEFGKVNEEFNEL